MKKHSVDQYWKILDYEMQMYLGAQLMRSASLPTEELHHAVLHHTLMESSITELIILHMKILVEIFLQREGPDVKDINIDDLIPSWRRNHSGLAYRLRLAYIRALPTDHSPRWYLDMYLVHPNKRRPAHYNWSPIIERMDPPLRAVLRTMPANRLRAREMLAEPAALVR